MTLHRIGRRLWRIGRQLYYTHTHTPLLEESSLESALETADKSPESANSNAYSPKIGVWVRALRSAVVIHQSLPHLHGVLKLSAFFVLHLMTRLRPKVTSLTNKGKTHGLLCIPYLSIWIIIYISPFIICRCTLGGPLTFGTQEYTTCSKGIMQYSLEMHEKCKLFV